MNTVFYLGVLMRDQSDGLEPSEVTTSPPRCSHLGEAPNHSLNVDPTARQLPGVHR